MMRGIARPTPAFRTGPRGTCVTSIYLIYYMYMLSVYALVESVHGFEWDTANETKSWIKHAVSRLECEQLFAHRPIVLQHDAVHSHVEPRFVALGRTDAHRLLFLVFTVRHQLIRVISARPMSRHDREAYENAEGEAGAT